MAFGGWVPAKGGAGAVHGGGAGRAEAEDGVVQGRNVYIYIHIRRYRHRYVDIGVV